jgi:hypothetical protein
VKPLWMGSTGKLLFISVMNISVQIKTMTVLIVIHHFVLGSSLDQ